MRGYRVRYFLIALYRSIIGDVQVITSVTDNTMERTIYLGYLDSKVDETRILYHVKQVKYLRVYSKWWLWERPRYTYELSYMKFVGMSVVDRGNITYPELCIGFLRNTKRPHLLAMDCHMKDMLSQYSA